ncbi:MAG: heme o synthase [Acidithiobacillus ferrivorans]|uniref:Protoheme IX farnesyltransferase n=1 Tax=Acidithiobacillus ferrivorans SS3 TaxID=743299 RepID=G0JNF9_9PROT|nr:heme o synthase [Acidithiobacillus ferrivorans]AEM47189.1 Protoheme IX farnesyltransferase [Acidithiobacillus ferrivorans SS3]AEM47986.1 Protoheme IX farnesyltransferase [Acidithiobacillus ferrivorans SS3]MBU2765147.1 protoheme IX farnesyltransferase [Acidithiobacillus ferrivorans]MBU2768823.1 protoheme IX farnesyltransferase [Acidithiobacillus ferrivorans]MBU2849598.1 protoheme IX farnesyltransferase [Acidithiobacillus ferrivorans]
MLKEGLNTNSLDDHSGQRLRPSLLSDLWVLAKARVVSLLVFTAAVGEILAPNALIHWESAVAGLVGIALAGGAGGVLNQIVEPALDQHMRRTLHRPLAEGRISRPGAILYAAILMGAAIAILAWGTNPLTLVLTLVGTVGYGVVYTLYLKPSTPWNIVWGGLAGALPPLIGWSAITGSLAALPLVLVLLVFVWTPAHFWPLAICCRQDYAKACIPMLPVTHGVDRTRKEILNYAILTWIVSLVPAFLTGDWVYGAIAALSGAWFVWMALHLKALPEGQEMDRYARRMFAYSISYLFLLFTALILGKLVMGYGFF